VQLTNATASSTATRRDSDGADQTPRLTGERAHKNAAAKGVENHQTVALKAAQESGRVAPEPFEVDVASCVDRHNIAAIRA